MKFYKNFMVCVISQQNLSEWKLMFYGAENFARLKYLNAKTNQESGHPVWRRVRIIPP
jgi:hypothetical protein